jgi:hypothetical protein
MPALVAGIHVFLAGFSKQGVDGQNNKPGHDCEEMVRYHWNPL